MSGVPAHIYQKSIVRQKADGMGIEGKGVMVVEGGGVKCLSSSYLKEKTLRCKNSLKRMSTLLYIFYINDRKWSLNFNCYDGSSGKMYGAVSGNCSKDDPRATQETTLSTPPLD